MHLSSKRQETSQGRYLDRWFIATEFFFSQPHAETLRQHWFRKAFCCQETIKILKFKFPQNKDGYNKISLVANHSFCICQKVIYINIDLSFEFTVM